MPSSGRRIFENKFYVTQNDSLYQTSSKVFASLNKDKLGQESRDELSKSPQRPALNSYKREFSMPDHFHIEVPLLKSGLHKRIGTMNSSHFNSNHDGGDDVVMQSFENAPIGECTDSLLSKHNGWITI